MNHKKTFHFPFYTFISSLALLSSCTPPVHEEAKNITLGKNWKTSASPFIANAEENLPQVTSSTQDGMRTVFHWWEIYGDTVLNELEQEALQNSPTLEASIQRFQDAVWTLGIHQSDLYPTLSLASAASRQRIPKDLRQSTKVPVISSSPVSPTPSPTPIPTPTTSTKTVKGPSHYNILDTTLVVNYEADLWGKLWLTKQSYAALAQASLEDIDAIQLLLTYQVAKFYNTIRYYDIDIRMAQTLLQCIKEESSLLQSRFTSGISDLSPYLEIETKKEAIIAEIAELQGLKAKATTALAVLIGKEPATFTMPSSHAPWVYATPPYTLPSQVLSQRPDVRRSLREMESLIAQIGIAKTEYLPTLSLTALVGYEATKANRLFKWRNRIWSGSTSLGMTLLDAGKRESEVNSAIASYNAKAQEHITVCLTAIQEVEDSLSQYIAYEKELKAYVNQEIQNDALFTLSRDRFESGLTPYQNVLTAKEQKIASMRTTLQTEYNLQLASLELIKAIGGSWPQEEEKEEDKSLQNSTEN